MVLYHFEEPAIIGVDLKRRPIKRTWTQLEPVWSLHQHSLTNQLTQKLLHNIVVDTALTFGYAVTNVSQNKSVSYTLHGHADQVYLCFSIFCVIQKGQKQLYICCLCTLLKKSEMLQDIIHQIDLISPMWVKKGGISTNHTNNLHFRYSASLYQPDGVKVLHEEHFLIGYFFSLNVYRSYTSLSITLNR